MPLSEKIVFGNKVDIAQELCKRMGWDEKHAENISRIYITKIMMLEIIERLKK